MKNIKTKNIWTIVEREREKHFSLEKTFNLQKTCNCETFVAF